MCRLFIGADAQMWRTRLKSVRMRGYSTSVRLENFYWRVLEEIAQRDAMNLPQLLAKLHEELLEAHGEVANFSSFLRVCCGRYLMLQLSGDVPRDLDLPIRGLDAEGILRREAARLTSSSHLASLARSPVGAPPASAP
ncbi:MAG TPA: ribbon-helix-helix domain-containing protein [Roseiarcus sp.]|nr:ribbon-helix-helix domain-containing protein [Roseiarcus sp.]